MAERKKEMTTEQKQEVQLINCLENKKVNVRSVFKETDFIKDSKHYLAYPLAEPCEGVYVTPMLSNGQFVNVLTDNEKAYLEHVLGKNLSIYAKDEDNVWMNTKVRLKRGDNFFDMSDPWEYIKLKILMANKNDIAPSMTALEERPRETYRFVVVDGESENKEKIKKVRVKSTAYKLLDEISENRDKLAYIYEVMTAHIPAAKMTDEDLIAGIGEHIEANPALFVKAANDELLAAKILIRRCVNAGIVIQKGEHLFVAGTNAPLCEENQSPTFPVAAAFISNPKRAELKLSLEKKLEVR